MGNGKGTYSNCGWQLVYPHRPSPLAFFHPPLVIGKNSSSSNNNSNVEKYAPCLQAKIVVVGGRGRRRRRLRQRQRQRQRRRLNARLVSSVIFVLEAAAEEIEGVLGGWGGAWVEGLSSLPGCLLLLLLLSPAPSPIWAEVRN